MAHVVLKNISKRFGRETVIRGIDLEIGDGEFAVFVGPSGCGKSTLLRLIAGLEDISGGDLIIGGERVNAMPPRRRGVAMVFQSYALYPHMTAYENMAFGLSLAKRGGSEIDAAVREAAEILDITSLLDRLPKQLSGGQRQRVAIGRAIVRQPRVFLFDEPLSNLDAALRVQMRIEIARLHKRMGVTTIYVTHDQVEAMTLADRIVVLNTGRVEQVGTPLQLYHQPRNRFVAGFIGSPMMNFIETKVEAVDGEGARVGLPGGGTVVASVSGQGVDVGDAVTLGVRPEHIGIEGGGSAFSGVVEVLEQLGDASLLHVRIADGSLVAARLAGEAPCREGDRVTLRVSGQDCHLFDGDGNALPRLRRPG